MHACPMHAAAASPHLCHKLQRTAIRGDSRNFLGEVCHAMLHGRKMMDAQDPRRAR